MKSDKDVRAAFEGIRRFCVTLILVSVMTIVFVPPVMARLSEAGEEGIPIITRDESAAVKLLPLKMQIPDDPDMETSGDVRL